MKDKLAITGDRATIGDRGEVRVWARSPISRKMRIQSNMAMENPVRYFTLIIFILVCGSMIGTGLGVVQGAEPLRVGTFEVDASPRLGAPLAYDPCEEVETPLSCRGLVILGVDEPIVLVAVDWIGVGNASQDAFKEAIAEAVEGDPRRVAVHALHQHDAPEADRTAAELLAPFELAEKVYDPAWERDVIARTASAAREAVESARPATHLGLGEARVVEVASNRRILGEDGRVRATRYTACRDPELRAEPAGTIDPMLKMISFWADDTPIATLTYYATHPQSYYRTGLANPDFPGLARNAYQETTGVPLIHFNGAGGNIGAGKWNDGSPANRQVLVEKVEDALRSAWESTERKPIRTEDVDWRTVPVRLVPARHLMEDDLRQRLGDEAGSLADRAKAANDLAWLLRNRERDIELTCLRLGRAAIVHMPGELFVEYQLAAQAMRPDLFVAMAAYGDYGPGYIGTAEAYVQGGYEASPRASLVSPLNEPILLNAMAEILEAGQQQ